jgi:hypothetical protein
MAEPIAAARLQLEGALLRRGFWLYAWKIRSGERLFVYVGRTGDSSSHFAASPFARVARHLDLKEGAKANSLVHQLRAQGIVLEEADYRLLALGPLAPEAEDMVGHLPLRETVAALESALAGELKARGYNVVGRHWASSPLDEELFKRVLEAIDSDFPRLTREDQ